MMAHITYLSDASMDRKFGRRTIQSRAQSPQLSAELAQQPAAAAADFNLQFEVESYLRHQGQTFINRFDANSYLYITRALDQFDLDHAYGSLEQAFGPVQAESLIVGFTSELAVPARTESPDRPRPPPRRQTRQLRRTRYRPRPRLLSPREPRSSTPSSVASLSAINPTSSISRSSL